MMYGKKILSFIIVCIMCMGLLCGCGQNTNESVNQQENGESRYSIVCTTFPLYDWVREILGEKAEDFEVTLLLNKGVDMHSYQPTAEDIAKVASCDLFIYVGGESEEWVGQALKEATKENKQTLNMIEALGEVVKEEEIVEGMEHNHEHDESKEEHEEEHEIDEHVWLSVKNAKLFVEKLSLSIQKLDAQNAEIYQKNCDCYIEKLESLNDKYEEAVKEGSKKTLLFADRFPFRYLLDDYGLEYYAAFPGCSAETEASFETVVFLAEKIDELGLNSVIVIENSDEKIANTIIKNTKTKNQNILKLNSLQSVTEEDIQGGTTYLKVMESNLETIKEALQ